MTDGTIDSGIEFDLSSLLSVSDVSEVEFQLESATAASLVQPESAPQYHELKSRVVVGSPRTDFRESNMGSRTQLRQNLERQQVLAQEEREKQQALARQQQQQQSQNMAMPTPIFHSPEVPPKVLQVKTELQHPTEYHIKQKRQQAVKSFLNDSDDFQMPAHSMPNLGIHSTIDANWMSGSAPNEITEMADVDDFAMVEGFTLDSVDLCADGDLQFIQPTLTSTLPSTLPQQGMFQPGFTLEVESAGATSSSSCPPALVVQQLSPPTSMSEEESKMWFKDRQKKDNHNAIERRRRYNINDRIKELGQLLPKSIDHLLSARDLRQNKGTILKATVDYVRKMKKDVGELKKERDERMRLEKALQKQQLKFTQLVAVMQQKGLTCNGLEDTRLDTMVAPSTICEFMQHPPTPNPTPSSSAASSLTHHHLLPPSSSPSLAPAPTLTLTPTTCTSATSSFNSSFLPQMFSNAHVDFMEDNSPRGDPMLMSTPGSPDIEDPTM